MRDRSYSTQMMRSLQHQENSQRIDSRDILAFLTDASSPDIVMPSIAFDENCILCGSENLCHFSISELRFEYSGHFSIFDLIPALPEFDLSSISLGVSSGHLRDVFSL